MIKSWVRSMSCRRKVLLSKVVLWSLILSNCVIDKVKLLSNHSCNQSTGVIMCKRRYLCIPTMHFFRFIYYDLFITEQHRCKDVFNSVGISLICLPKKFNHLLTGFLFLTFLHDLFNDRWIFNINVIVTYIFGHFHHVFSDPFELHFLSCRQVILASHSEKIKYSQVSVWCVLRKFSFIFFSLKNPEVFLKASP